MSTNTPNTRQPASYLGLRASHQHFVSLYLRNGCDPLKTCMMMHQQDTEEQNKARAYRLMNREDIKQAISDKLLQREDKFDVTHQAMVERLFGLIDEVAQLPEGKQKLSHLRFILDVYSEVNKISGLQHVRHTHTNEESVTIQLIGMNTDAPSKELPAVDAEAEIIEGDPAQLPISFPSDHAVSWSLDDLDEISDELPKDLQ